MPGKSTIRSADRPRQSGFTLVETMATLAVAAILLTAAVPPMQDFIVRNRMSTEVNTFIASAYLARSEAVKRLQSVVICSANSTRSNCSGSDEWVSGWIVFADLNNNGRVDSGEPILQRSALPGGLSVKGTRDLYSYNPNGQLNNHPVSGQVPNGHNEFCNPDEIANTREVWLSNEGRVRVNQMTTAGCPVEG